MRVGLFIPCYVDQFYPQVGIATLQLPPPPKQSFGEWYKKNRKQN
jgi:hypothetical protein